MRFLTSAVSYQEAHFIEFMGNARYLPKLRLLVLENNQNTYDLRFKQNIALGLSISDSAIAVIESYLDGKPAGKLKTVDRNAILWASQFLRSLSTNVYESEPFILALARYLGQEKTSNFELIRHIAKTVPGTVRKAVRYSGLVLRQKSMKWKEIERLATFVPEEFSEFVQICHTFDRAHHERITEVETYQKLLVRLSVLELITYASLYAFEKLIPQQSQDDADAQDIWSAINDILIWKLKTATDKSFQLTEADIGNSLRLHLSPFLFPSHDFPKAREDIYQNFKYLVAAQLELNSFISQSVEAFCYDDSISFEFSGSDLVIVERDNNARNAWQRNGEKLSRLHNYWFYRAFELFVASGMDSVQIGRPENQERNQFAFIKTIRTQLQLREVYGLNDSVQSETKLQVDLFQALLSLELMTAFYNVDFVLPYRDYLGETGNWRLALSRLAMNGLLQGLQNRFPLTWSDKEAKVNNIRSWTVSENFPQGNAKAAEAILDFWTCDMKHLSTRLRSNEPTLPPELYERPILKIGRYLFQLPWMMAMQNNSSAAINNLRRIGARRLEAREETRRIEQRLAKCFEERGFQVCLNYHPARTLSDDPGEIDLVCARDGQILVLEVKSSFLRKSQKDAWLYKTNTLRKAGLQLRRKVAAVKTALLSDVDLALALGIGENMEIPTIQGWIVDTSIEHDHEFFSGFLKVSLEEVLIALRDDRHWLNDPGNLFIGQDIKIDDIEDTNIQTVTALYPNGFSGKDFIEVIEQQKVWSK